ncbi:MAG: hypothetical protein AB7F50_02025 [Fimbriimonadaceae bacterium]
MTALQRRVLGHVTRNGDAFALAGQPAHGVFSLASFGTMRLYLPVSTLDAMVPPYVLCLVGQATTAVEGDPVTWNGRSLAVRRVVEARWGGVVAGRLLVLG